MVRGRCGLACEFALERHATKTRPTTRCGMWAPKTKEHDLSFPFPCYTYTHLLVYFPILRQLFHQQNMHLLYSISFYIQNYTQIR